MSEDEKPDEKRLTPKEQAFVDAYAGNGTEAARLAGYEGDDDTLAVTASRLLRRAKVVAALESRNAPARETRIANREARQEFWTDMMKATEQETRDRLKASELLARSEGDFIERHELTGKDGGPIETRTLSDAQLNARFAELLAKATAAEDKAP